MGLDYEKMSKMLDDYIASPEGIAYFENKRIIQEIQEGRYKRFETYLLTHDFDKLMYRLILEHGEEWREKCYHNGYEPYPNNKLQFIIEYVTHNLEQIRVAQLENVFNTQIWFFRGYYFRMMHGQGSCFDLYNGDDFRHLLSA